MARCLNVKGGTRRSIIPMRSSECWTQYPPADRSLALRQSRRPEIQWRNL